MRIAVIGATGVVGREIVADLLSLQQSGQSFFEPPNLFATARTAGEAIAWEDDEELIVEPFDADALRGTDAAVVATPADAAGGIATSLRQLGVKVIDLSRAHREQAPLFFDGVLSPRAAMASSSVVALPSAEALQLARVLHPLKELQPIGVRATLLMAASGAGQAGVRELAESTGRLLNGMEPDNPLLGHRLAFNAIPQVGAFAGSDAQGELDVDREMGRLMPGLRVSATALWCPWFYSHVQSVAVQFQNQVSVEKVRSLLESAAHVKVLDQPADTVYPMPSLATGDEAVLVGRLRADTLENGILFVSAMDNARASAAHAVEALGALARAAESH